MAAPARISVIEGEPIGPTDPEFVEMMRFESGLADEVAQSTAGPHDEPWLNFLAATQPHTQPAIEAALSHPDLRDRIGGRIIVVLLLVGALLLLAGSTTAPFIYPLF